MGSPESLLLEQVDTRDFVRFVAKRNLVAKEHKRREALAHQKSLAHGQRAGK